MEVLYDCRGDVMSKRYGFTITELSITLIIIIILALIIIPAYRGYVKRGIATEGKALLNEINAAEQIYYARRGRFFVGTEGQQYGASFGVDTRRNKYFTSYIVSTSAANAGTYTAILKYDDKNVMTIIGHLDDEPTIVDNFSGAD